MGYLSAALIFPVLFSVFAQAQSTDYRSIPAHIRESFGYPPEVVLSMSEPGPSELKGFKAADLILEYNGNRQSQRVYISETSPHYFLGVVKDLSSKPDEERWSKLMLNQSPYKGSAKAAVTVAEFSDLQCPACLRAYHEITKKIIQDYGDKVRLVFKHLPLPQHQWAESAAVAAECARLQGEGKFWSMHDAFFENQSTVTVKNVREKSIEFAKAAKADAKAFASCYDKRETLPKVHADIAQADAAGVNSTPTFLVQGHLVTGFNYKALRAVIDEFLNGTHAK